MTHRIGLRALALGSLGVAAALALADNGLAQSAGTRGQTSQTKSVPATGMATGPASGGATPSSAPARGAASAVPNALAGRAAAIAKLLSSPDNTVLPVNGKNVSAGQLRDRIRKIAAQVAKPGRQAAVKKPLPEPHPNPASLAEQNRSLLAELQQSLARAGGGGGAGAGAGAGGGGGGSGGRFERKPVSAPGSTGPGDVARLRASAVADLDKPCPLRAPFMETPKGWLTPGGMIVLGGSCFGAAQGELRMYGEFPNGMVRLQIQLWADGGAAALVPADLTGVMDQKATLRLVRPDGQESNPREMEFTAARETQAVPAQLVRCSACADFPNDCVSQSAYHISYNGDNGNAGTMGGADIWVAAVGNGWTLQALNVVDSFGGVTTSGFDQGPSNAAQIVFQWGASELSVSTSHGFFDLIGETEYTYLASYSFSIAAVGPAGVSPDPAVKPPYAGKSANPAGGIRAGSLSTQPTQAAEAPSASAPRPVGPQPTWNTIIGTGARVPQNPISGQPTAVPPGAAVQTSP